MASTTGAIRAALGAMLAFAFLSGILSLIGLAGLQRNCYTLDNNWLLPGGGNNLPGITMALQSLGLPHTGIRGFNRSYGCSDIYRYYWFMFAFETVTLFGLSILAAVGLLAASGLSWMAWLTVLTLLYIQGSDSFLALQQLTYGSQVDYGTFVYSRLTSAGWILTAIANLGLIFLLGWRPRKTAAAGGPIKY